MPRKYRIKQNQSETPAHHFQELESQFSPFPDMEIAVGPYSGVDGEELKEYFRNHDNNQED